MELGVEMDLDPVDALAVTVPALHLEHLIPGFGLAGMITPSRDGQPCLNLTSSVHSSPPETSTASTRPTPRA